MALVALTMFPACALLASPGSDILQRAHRECAPLHPVAESDPLAKDFLDRGLAESRAIQKCEDDVVEATLPPVPKICDTFDPKLPIAILKQCTVATRARTEALGAINASRPTDEEVAINRLESEYRQSLIMLDYYMSH